MRPPSLHAALPLVQDPPVVTSLAALQRAQLELSALVTPVTRIAEVPLAKAAGRVLAEPLPAHGPRGDDAPAARQPAVAHAGTDGARAGDMRPALARGTRLDPRHLPLLAAGGRALAPVLVRPRVGVIALHPSASPAAEPAAEAAAWVAATAERLGAQAFEAACKGPCPQHLLQTLEMFVDECELIVTIGFLGPAACDAVRRAQAARGQPAAIATHALRPFGALQAMQVGRTPVIAISADLSGCVSTFTTLLTPAIRRLQGRAEPLPAVRAATLDDLGRADDERGRLFPVQAASGPLDTRLRVRRSPSPDPARALAGADGLAWHAAELARGEPAAVAYFPFDAWTA